MRAPTKKGVKPGRRKILPIIPTMRDDFGVHICDSMCPKRRPRADRNAIELYSPCIEPLP